MAPLGHAGARTRMGAIGCRRAFAIAAVSAAILTPTGAVFAENSPPDTTDPAVAPHRATYTMTLGVAREGSPVKSAEGAMTYEWGESCDAWTVRQHYNLKLETLNAKTIESVTDLSTWEAKNGSRYRFDHAEADDGAPARNIKGSAEFATSDQEGAVSFTAPDPRTIKLQRGALFPSAHALLLIHWAEAGKSLVLRRVFDGTQIGSAPQVTATIGPKIDPDPQAGKLSPLLQRPGWRVRLVFLPPDETIEKPGYELDMLLLDNGVSREITVDYGSYTVATRLDSVTPLTKPKC